MADELTIVMDRERIDLKLLLTADPSMPNAVRALNTSTAFAGVVRGKTVAACLVEYANTIYNISYLVVDVSNQGKKFERQLLEHAISYIKGQYGQYIEGGCGNADIQMIALYQELGFRLLGVWPDYYLSDNRTASIENRIYNRDMVRFRLDLFEKTMLTTGGAVSGAGR